MFTLAFALLLLLSVVTHLLIWNVLYAKLTPSEAPPLDVLPSVTVVIATRNSQNKLKLLLHDLEKQNYQDLSVLVMDDASTDSTEHFMDENSSTRVSYVRSKTQVGKKRLIQEYISKAEGEFLLFTDVDCRIESEYWVRRMVQKTAKYDVVLGYSPFTWTKGFTNNLARYDNLLIAFQYLSLARVGHAYMGVGRNLLVRKSTRLEHNSKLNYGILSGDDDLFIQSLPSKKEVTICIHPESSTRSDSKTSLTEFWNQKRRHVTSSSGYDLRSKMMVAAIFITQLLHYILIFLSCLNAIYLVGILLLIFRVTIVLIAFHRHSKELDVRGLAPKVLYLDFFHLIFNILLVCSNLIHPFKKWS